MKELIMTVVTAGVASAVIGMFFEDDMQIGKYIRLVLSICFLSAVIPGGIKMFSRIMDGSGITFETGSFDSENCKIVYEEYVINDAKKRIEAELDKKIFDNTGIKAEEINIEFNVTRTNETTDVDISAITVYLSAGDMRESVFETVNHICGKEPEIIIVSLE